jgi:acetyl-CoA carboxylase beta subunit
MEGMEMKCSNCKNNIFKSEVGYVFCILLMSGETNLVYDEKKDKYVCDKEEPKQ